MSVQTVIKNGTIVSPRGSRRGHLIVDGGVIAGIAEHDGDLPAAETVIDATGLHVLPGLIDPDVKFREPGLEYKEGWDTGSQAAVCGGVTTVIDMPNPVNTVSNLAEFAAKRSAAEGRSYCNYALMAWIDYDRLNELRALADSGVCGFKAALSGPFGKMKLMSSGELLDAWRVVAEIGRRCSLVPESRDIIAHARQKVLAEGRADGLAFRDARPPVAEVEGIARAVALAEFAHVRLSIATLSSAQGVDAVRRAKALGRIDLVAEAKVHYCVIDGSIMDSEGLGSMLAMFPPVRTQEHTDALMAGLVDGTIDMLGTDHSPHTHAEKHYDNRMADIWGATPGWPGVETAASLMLTAVNQGKLTIERYVECQSEAPAKAWGLWPRKGNLAPGADADITIVDLGKAGIFDERRLHSRHKLSPFHGRPFVGAPVYTVIAGRVVARDGDLTTTEPRGQFVPVAV